MANQEHVFFVDLPKGKESDRNTNPMDTVRWLRRRFWRQS
jgi:hypothetical protein